MPIYTEKDATVVDDYKDQTTAFASFRVAEEDGNTEYTVSTPVKDQAGNDKTAKQLEADLSALVIAQRKAKYVVRQPTGIGSTVKV